MKTKNILTVLLVAIFSNGLFAQYYFHKKWDKRFGGLKSDVGKGILVSDGGFMIAGYSNSGISGDKTDTSRGSYDFWVIKIDSQGNKLWDKTYGGRGFDGITCFIQTKDGGYAFCGSSNSNISGEKTENSKGNDDYWLIKTDANGSKVWDSSYGGFASDVPYCIIQARDSGFLIVGYSASGIGGDKTEKNWDSTYFYDDGWVVKTDKNGNRQWDRTLGGTDEDGLSTAIQTSDGGYLVGGYSVSDSSGNKSARNHEAAGPWGIVSDYWLIKLDANGVKQWDKVYGGSGTDNLDGIAKISDDEYLLYGVSGSDSSGDKTQDAWDSGDFWIIAIDSAGKKMWDRTYGGWGDDGNQLVSAQYLEGGKLLLSGSSIIRGGGDQSDYDPTVAWFTLPQTWVLLIDSNGNKLWDKSLFIDKNYILVGKVVSVGNNCYEMACNTSAGIGFLKSQPNYDSTEQTSDIWVIKFCMNHQYNGLQPLPAESGLQVAVYPNPASDNLHIALNENDIHQAVFTLSDISGRILYRKKENHLAPGYTKALDVHWLAKGVYFVTVESNKGKLTKKVVKE